MARASPRSRVPAARVRRRGGAWRRTNSPIDPCSSCDLLLGRRPVVAGAYPLAPGVAHLDEPALRRGEVAGPDVLDFDREDAELVAEKPPEAVDAFGEPRSIERHVVGCQPTEGPALDLAPERGRHRLVGDLLAETVRTDLTAHAHLLARWLARSRSPCLDLVTGPGQRSRILPSSRTNRRS